LGYGLAFGFAVMIIGFISAQLNPAVSLALLIIGKINGVQFISAVGGQFIGAFCGAVLVWLHFLPHFKTVPNQYNKSGGNALLTGDTVSQTDLDIASYNVNPKDVAARGRGLGDIGYAFEDLKYYLKDSFNVRTPIEQNIPPLVEISVRSGEATDQVHGLQNHRRSLGSSDDVHRDSDNGSTSSPSASKSYSSLNSSSSPKTSMDPEKRHIQKQNYNRQPTAADIENAIEQRSQHLDKLYEAAVEADHNLKLSIFCTRPAIYSPMLNLLCEFLSTTALIYGILLISARQELLYGPERSIFHAEEGIWVGFFIFLCVLGLGGPTGIAANPARDFAPRCAHAVLPIPGKGKSEFHYSWVPVVGPLLGGCAAAGLYIATQLMNNDFVAADSVFPAPVQVG
jgi:glycerol uptake facilitator-like aquaporin